MINPFSPIRKIPQKSDLVRRRADPRLIIIGRRRDSIGHFFGDGFLLLLLLSLVHHIIVLTMCAQKSA